MPGFARLAAALAILAPPALPGALAAQEELSAPLTVRVDSARHEVVLTAGPFDLPSMAGHGHDESMMAEFVGRFEWPVEAMGRGFTLELRDGAGRKVSQRALHHLNVINTSRRQLLLPLRERIMAIGRETRNVMLPNTVGLPLSPGTRMRLEIMWHNETPTDYAGVTATLRMRYSPANLLPRPVAVLPIAMDVADARGRSNAFTVPPGESSVQREFVMPLDARLLGVSGHMHDWAAGLRLEDAATGRVLVRLEPTLDSLGRITHMPVKLFGIVGDGLRLHAGRRYRLVASYRNQSGGPLPAMGILSGILAPRDMRDWPESASKAAAYVDEGAATPASPTPATPATHSH